MRRDTFSLLAALTVAGSVTFAQAPAQVSDAQQTPSQSVTTTTTTTTQTPDTTLTGCLIQGSGPNVYILENGRMSTAAASEKGKSYVLTIVPGSTAVDFRSQVNRQVRIVGLTDDKAASAVVISPDPASPTATVVKVEEKDMPKFSARTVTRVGDTCVVAG